MSQIQQVKDAIDLVELIGERVTLKRTGRNWSGLCPFHSEHSPSFFVNEELQRYKCFGCGESGDAFTFLEKYEGLTFGEALEQLAQRAGVTLEAYRPTTADTHRAALLAIMNMAKEYYHYVLTAHRAGATARAYLARRGVTQESITLFQLGYALPGWEGLSAYLIKKKKLDPELLVQAGLVVKNRQGRVYDRFRDRIMFPLTNHRGQVVGFSGRVLEQPASDSSLATEMSAKQTTAMGNNQATETSNKPTTATGANQHSRSQRPPKHEPKYINTPETSLYHKAEMLFGYHELLQFIRKANEVVVVEGEFDVISSSQAHVNQIVAIKGSAFTPHHARLIRRVADRVLLALDMDQAGIEATKRAIPLAQEAGLELRVIRLPSQADGQPKDPDELARHQPKAWREAVKQSQSVYQFLMEAAWSAHDPTTPEGKRHIVTALATSLSQIRHEVEKDYYVKALAEKLQVSVNLVHKDITRLAKNPQAKMRSVEVPTHQQTMSRREKLEKYLWFLFLNDSPYFRHRIKQLVKFSFAHPQLQLLQAQLVTTPAVASIEAFSKLLPTDLQQLVFDLQLPTLSLDIEQLDVVSEWKKTLTELHQLTVQTTIKQITAELDALDKKPIKTTEDEQRQQQLLTQIVTLQAQRPIVDEELPTA